ncbi:MAG: putative entry exclusion protein TrbK-alt [Parasphingorhabdus sp.]|uniref:putative entry exclusion protein TrbK-alt n=1 Tax=Parasphingorhabdus sp. TaxID=2709688 RepID=UPI0030032282
MNEKRHPLLKRMLMGMAGLALVVGVVAGFSRTAQFQEASNTDSRRSAPPDPISVELRRCSALPHMEAMDDTKCRRAWTLNRQRFFGKSEELLSDLPDRNKE